MDFADLSSDLQRRLFGVSVDDLRQLISSSRDELADLRVSLNRLQQEVAQLRSQLEASSHREVAALEERSLDALLALHPGCQDALQRFGIEGGGARTLREAAPAEDLDTLVATIKNLLKDRAG